jgi:hypothetical protein
VTDDPRARAIKAALATGIPIHKGYIAEVIDAIPGDVHAHLAQQKGHDDDTVLFRGSVWGIYEWLRSLARVKAGTDQRVVMYRLDDRPLPPGACTPDGPADPPPCGQVCPTCPIPTPT